MYILKHNNIMKCQFLSFFNFFCVPFAILHLDVWRVKSHFNPLRRKDSHNNFFQLN